MTSRGSATHWFDNAQEKVISRGSAVVANSPSEAQAFMRTEVERWAKLIREANIKAD